MNIHIRHNKVISGCIYKCENELNNIDDFSYYQLDSITQDKNISKNIIGKVNYKGHLSIPKGSHQF